MENSLTFFIGTFTTLLAVIDPLVSLPIFLKLLDGQEKAAHKKVARQSCIYATLLTFFFLLFGTLVLKLFSVPLSMIRIVGGIILMRIGFSLFMPSPSAGVHLESAQGGNIAFVPLAMPLMFGPGVLATILGWSSLVRHPISNFTYLISISLAIVAAMLVTYLTLAYAEELFCRIGPAGIDAVTRIVGFLVSAIGMGLIFNGVIEGLENYKTILGS